ncbi:Membralin, partial [Operophtera brumata]
MSAAGPPDMNNLPLPPGINPDNNLLPGGPLINPALPRTRNNNPLFNMRERLFHALFFKFAVAYARTFPRPVRRFFEFLVLLKALVAFFVLAYIHIAFSRSPTTCLNQVKDSWPRDGILRVEILRNADQDYSLEQSYAREQKLKKDKEDEYIRDGTDYGNITRLHEELHEMMPGHVETAHVDKGAEPVDVNVTIVSGADVKPASSIWEGIIGLVDDSDASSKLTDYGFLRLSPSARIRLKIPVKIVTLDPTQDECFGDPFSRFVLDEFLGYDDLLMASIKTLAENEDNKGYLRNVITGEHYRFVSMQTARSSYIGAFFIMIVF